MVTDTFNVSMRRARQSAHRTFGTPDINLSKDAKMQQIKEFALREHLTAQPAMFDMVEQHEHTIYFTGHHWESNSRNAARYTEEEARNVAAQLAPSPVEVFNIAEFERRGELFSKVWRATAEKLEELGVLDRKIKAAVARAAAKAALTAVYGTDDLNAT
jgi:hypothetical protein